MKPIRSSLVAVMALVSAACSSPEWKFVDDVNGSDLSFSGRAPAGAYVPGGELRVRLVSSDEGQDFKGWRMESTHPAVLEIDSTGGGAGFVTATVLARAEGKATLRVLQTNGEPAEDPESGEPVEFSAEVKVPDRIELHPAVPLIADPARGIGALEELRISPHANPGKLVIRYFAGEREFRGNLPESHASAEEGSFSVMRISTSSFGRADVVQISEVTGETTGALRVALSDTVSKVIPVIPVTDDQLRRAELIAPAKGSVGEGKQGAVVLAVFDAQDRYVTGVPARFSANDTPMVQSSGEEVINEGDGVLFKGSSDDLTIRAEGPNGLRAEVKVQGRDPRLLTQAGCGAIPVASTVLLVLYAAMARRRKPTNV